MVLDELELSTLTPGVPSGVTGSSGLKPSGEAWLAIKSAPKTALVLLAGSVSLSEPAFSFFLREKSEPFLLFFFLDFSSLAGVGSGATTLDVGTTGLGSVEVVSVSEPALVAPDRMSLND